jgi:aspartyl-tRNA(Asn)/glutamyl-tRNA(Gln) amidotransferase subunit C
MASPINKKTLRHLAELARIELNSREEEKILKDLQKIVGYFEELQELDAKGVQAVSGGTNLKNIFREDVGRTPANRGTEIESFPEEQDGFLKIPAVFD